MEESEGKCHFSDQVKSSRSFKTFIFFLLPVGPSCGQNFKMEEKELEFSADKET